MARSTSSKLVVLIVSSARHAAVASEHLVDDDYNSFKKKGLLDDKYVHRDFSCLLLLFLIAKCLFLPRYL